jgi:uncharacterized protein YndB with AHSA1/START domain
MTSTLDVRLERLVAATPEQAFRTWCDATSMARWYSPEPGWDDAVATSDVRVGGEWRVEFGSVGERYAESGVYREVDPPSRLTYTSVFTFPDGRSFETLVTVTFAPRGDKTLVTLVDSGFPDEAMRSAHENGWPSFLAAFETVLADATS